MVNLTLEESQMTRSSIKKSRTVFISTELSDSWLKLRYISMELWVSYFYTNLLESIVKIENFLLFVPPTSTNRIPIIKFPIENQKLKM